MTELIKIDSSILTLLVFLLFFFIKHLHFSFQSQLLRAKLLFQPQEITNRNIEI